MDTRRIFEYTLIMCDDDYEYIHEGEVVDKLIEIDGVLHYWDDSSMEYKAVNSRRYKWDRKDYLN